ncbi:MAG TPA: hypothetical protein DCS93_15345, partial [Microscillaceae bacterium]|nr:hypothetical protein [Microscillaceae bacterium]
MGWVIAQAQTTIYLVRHAEKAQSKSRDPQLTAEGKARAQALKKLLKKDKIAAVYSTKTTRTMETGRPVAEANKLEVQNYDHRDAEFLAQVLQKHQGKTTLVVGHSNTVPALLNRLLAEDRYKNMDEKVYDNLVKITQRKNGKIDVAHIKFGQASPPTFPKNTASKVSYKARDADVKTIDGFIKALYDVISGPKGQQRNWGRFRSLMRKNARMQAISTRPNGQQVMTTMTPEGYISRSGPYLVGNGFFESEIGRRVERFGNVAHVFSTYESRNTKNGKVFMR